MVNRNFWRGKKVFLTGHSGFKGSWMTMTLNYLDAEVYGYSLKPKSDPSLFNECRLDKKSYSKFADIRDYELLKKSLIDQNDYTNMTSISFDYLYDDNQRFKLAWYTWLMDIEEI